LDQELAVVFDNMQGQPIDHKKLRADEDAWIAALHRDCSDMACIDERYRTRLQVLRDESLRIASPATYEEARPFVVPENLQTRAERSIGKPCVTRAGLVDASIPGFAPMPGFQPVLGAGFVVVVRQAGDRDFAFLLTSAENEGRCLVHDSVALPSNTAGGHFLQCSNQDPSMSGFGIRGPSPGSLVAFWIVGTKSLRFERVAMKVLGVEHSLRCHQPESAD
jgi:hypothetical protein